MAAAVAAVRRQLAQLAFEWPPSAAALEHSGRRIVLLVLAPACGHPLDERSFPHANLIVISLDTLRIDGLSSEGGLPGVSPALDAFAREAVVFEHARATAPHTAPSHMSLFTSLYPSVHGVQNVAHADDPRTPDPCPIRFAWPSSSA